MAPSTVHIVQGGLDDPRVIAKHFATNHEETPPESVHVFDVQRLREPDIAFCSAWDGETLLGESLRARPQLLVGDARAR
jgi:putative acetyltransferase